MKKILSIAVFVMLAGSFFAQSETPQTFEGSGGLKFEFSSTVKEFGDVPIRHPEISTHQFVIKNTGTVPVVISDAKASCSCTVAEKPKEPIMPGQEAYIKAFYSAAGEGPFTKSVTVTIQGMEDKPITLYLKGKVINNEPSK